MSGSRAVKPTLDSLRLRALALELLPKVAKKGDCVAVTGSAARGNATPGSNLDLWVLGKRAGLSEFTTHGTRVTLRCQRPLDALSLENLAYAEVDDLLLLDDRGGAFEKVRSTWKRVRRRVRAETIRAAQRRIEFDLNYADGGGEWQRVTFLSLASYRLLALHGYLEHGWHAPKLAMLRASLSPALQKRLDLALALPKKVGPLAADLKKARTEAVKLEGTAWIAWPERTGEDAALAARIELLEEVLPRVFTPWGITDVRGVELLGRVAPATKRLFERLQPKPGPGRLKAVERNLTAIRNAL